jgi:hypothetical protein
VLAISFATLLACNAVAWLWMRSAALLAAKGLPVTWHSFVATAVAVVAVAAALVAAVLAWFFTVWLSAFEPPLFNGSVLCAAGFGTVMPIAYALRAQRASRRESTLDPPS